ncbi:tetratricopeptide repeat protein [Flavobacterium arcticum]|uniref:Tetratricopeptide repeat protein n=1 Tax=Flavobacterium arcticum TaxID=1784713 RepID=A0A345HAW3_9FLAO|nr:tetratricopeptide repeat protein [Flavobacterium arcticum]AXG73723.1 tetratricopeptide repeat protein [Flavobacterium arcticum]KAF2511674.1 tetratricopeptide repeat protein [Flavobacterium arcticum]
MKSNRFSILTLLLLVFPLIAIAQDDDSIKTIGDKACECTKEISTDQVRDSIVKKINDCISSQILLDQMTSQFGTPEEIREEVSKLTDNDTVAEIGKNKGKNIVITMDKDFDEIQQYMFENCYAVKVLMSSNNAESKHSMSKNKKALQFYEEGEAHLVREEYDMAIVSFNKAVKKDPKFAFAWDNLGISYRKRGNYKEAIKCYEKSLEVDPTGKMPLQNLGVAYEYLKEYQKSAEVYDRYIIQYPNDPEGYYGAARMYYFAGDYAKGVDKAFKAYLMYKELQSPYISDAQQVISAMYNELKEKGKLDIFLEAAKNNNIEINE